MSAVFRAGVDCDEVRIRSVDESWSRRVPLHRVPRGRPLNGHRGVCVSIQLLRMEEYHLTLLLFVHTILLLGLSSIMELLVLVYADMRGVIRLQIVSN